MTVTYKFDSGVNDADRERIKRALGIAFEKGEILPCKCPTVEAWAYETIRPDFQASLSCSCDIMRPLYSSTPDTD